MSIHDSFGLKYANADESFPLSGKNCTFPELMNKGGVSKGCHDLIYYIPFH